MEFGCVPQLPNANSEPYLYFAPWPNGLKRGVVVSTRSAVRPLVMHSGARDVSMRFKMLSLIEGRQFAVRVDGTRRVIGHWESAGFTEKWSARVYNGRRTEVSCDVV